MANSEDIDNIVGELAKTSVEESTTISFAGRSLKWDNAVDVKAVVETIRNCKNMVALKLEGNTLGVEAAKEIAKELEAHPELKRALWRDMFTGRLKSEIPQALRFLSSGLQLAGAQLVELDLSDNAFGPIGVEGIAELLKSPTCFALQELRLNNNGLGIQGGKVLANSLLECYKNSMNEQKPIQLKVFICGRNRLENDGATAIAEVFKLYGTLEEIQMPQNGIFYPGIAALANSLERNPNLKHINFNDNIFTVEGAKAMSVVLPKLLNLEIINLGDCLIKSEGATLLAASFTQHSKLKEVNLGYNEIDQRGALDVVKSLENKAFLEKLELDGNSFGMNGRKAILDALRSCEKLNILGSLSEDEDEDDDDVKYDDDDDDDSDENRDECEKDHDDSSIIEVKNDQPTITAIPSTPEEFLNSPSLGRFIGIGENRTNLLINHILNVSTGLEYNIATFVKIAECCKLNDQIAQNVKDSLLSCCDEILSREFRKAEDEDNVALLTNTILVTLGLIKSEDKTYKPPSDLSGPLLVLESCVKQPYFSKKTKENLQLFLSRYYESVEKTGSIKHKLMQALYQ